MVLMELVGSEGQVGSVVVGWRDLVRSASLNAPIDGWFRAAREGERQGGRELHLRARLLTTPIEGECEQPIFDPRDDLHGFYMNVLRGLAAADGTTIRDQAAASRAEWLLSQLRARCGIGEVWDYVLRMAQGLSLPSAYGLSPASAWERREAQLRRIKDAVQHPPDLRPATRREHDAMGATLQLVLFQVPAPTPSLTLLPSLFSRFSHFSLPPFLPPSFPLSLVSRCLRLLPPLLFLAPTILLVPPPSPLPSFPPLSLPSRATTWGTSSDAGSVAPGPGATGPSAPVPPAPGLNACGWVCARVRTCLMPTPDKHLPCPIVCVCVCLSRCRRPTPPALPQCGAIL